MAKNIKSSSFLLLNSMWLSGLAVLPNLHTAKIHEALCTSEAGDA